MRNPSVFVIFILAHFALGDYLEQKYFIDSDCSTSSVQATYIPLGVCLDVGSNAYLFYSQVSTIEAGINFCTDSACTSCQSVGSVQLDDCSTSSPLFQTARILAAVPGFPGSDWVRGDYFYGQADCSDSSKVLVAYTKAVVCRPFNAVIDNQLTIFYEKLTINSGSYTSVYYSDSGCTVATNTSGYSAEIFPLQQCLVTNSSGTISVVRYSVSSTSPLTTSKLTTGRSSSSATTGRSVATTGGTFTEYLEYKYFDDNSCLTSTFQTAYFPLDTCVLLGEGLSLTFTKANSSFVRQKLCNDSSCLYCADFLALDMALGSCIASTMDLQPSTKLSIVTSVPGFPGSDWIRSDFFSGLASCSDTPKKVVAYTKAGICRPYATYTNETSTYTFVYEKKTINSGSYSEVYYSDSGCTVATNTSDFIAETFPLQQCIVANSSGIISAERYSISTSPLTTSKLTTGRSSSSATTGGTFAEYLEYKYFDDNSCLTSTFQTAYFPLDTCFLLGEGLALTFTKVNSSFVRQKLCNDSSCLFCADFLALDMALGSCIAGTTDLQPTTKLSIVTSVPGFPGSDWIRSDGFFSGLASCSDTPKKLVGYAKAGICRPYATYTNETSTYTYLYEKKTINSGSYSEVYYSDSGCTVATNMSDFTAETFPLQQCIVTNSSGVISAGRYSISTSPLTTGKLTTGRGNPTGGNSAAGTDGDSTGIDGDFTGTGGDSAAATIGASGTSEDGEASESAAAVIAACAVITLASLVL